MKSNKRPSPCLGRACAISLRGRGPGWLPSVRLGGLTGNAGLEGVACASPGGNHRKQTLSSLARSLEYKTSRPGGWRAGTVPGSLGVTRCPEVLSLVVE